MWREYPVTRFDSPSAGQLLFLPRVSHQMAHQALPRNGKDSSTSGHQPAQKTVRAADDSRPCGPVKRLSKIRGYRNDVMRLSPTGHSPAAQAAAAAAAALNERIRAVTFHS